MNIKETLNNIYLDYCNNYLTKEKFAEANNITVAQASMLIGMGRDINHNKGL